MDSTYGPQMGMNNSKPINIAGVTFLENAAIIKTMGLWEKGGLVSGLRENIEEGQK